MSLLVNWNTLSDGSAPDTLYNFTVYLYEIEYWGNNVQIEYYRPSQLESLRLLPELHKSL